MRVNKKEEIKQINIESKRMKNFKKYRIWKRSNRMKKGN